MPPKMRIVPTFTGPGLIPPVKRVADCSKAYLDCASFPHIIRLILSYASDETLVSCRNKSRDVRDWCDQLLFDHVFLDAAGRGLRFPHYPHHWLPFWWPDLVDPESTALEMEARRRKQGYIRVIDSHVPLPTGFPFRRAGPFVDDPGVDHPPTEEISPLFADEMSMVAPDEPRGPPPGRVIRRTGDLAGPQSLRLPATTYVDEDCYGGTIPVPQCERYVLHLNFDPLGRYGSKNGAIQLPPTVRDLTLVLGENASYPLVRSDSGQQLYFGHSLISGLPQPSRLGRLGAILPHFFLQPSAVNVRLTLVGIELLHASAFVSGHPTLSPASKFEEAKVIIDSIARDPSAFLTRAPALTFVGVPTDPSKVDREAAVERISAMTVEEWTASLSPRDRHLLVRPAQSWKPPR